jgi:hypothetical protein
MPPNKSTRFNEFFPMGGYQGYNPYTPPFPYMDPFMMMKLQQESSLEKLLKLQLMKDQVKVRSPPNKFNPLRELVHTVDEINVNRKKYMDTPKPQRYSANKYNDYPVAPHKSEYANFKSDSIFKTMFGKNDQAPNAIRKNNYNKYNDFNFEDMVMPSNRGRYPS